jgi:soluble lytic murein transglycosylase-like protein
VPKFPTYSRQVGLSGGSTASYASDAIAAPARALQGLGNAVSGLGDDLYAREQKIRQTQDDTWFTKARAETALGMITAEQEAQRSATDGAQGYVEGIRSQFHQTKEQRLASAPSERARAMYDEWATNYDVTLTQRSAGFQAKSEIAKRSTDFAEAMNAHAQTIFADPTQYDAVVRRAMDDFEGAKQWMTPEQEADAKAAITTNLQLARAKNLAEFSPEQFMAEVAAPTGNIYAAMETVESTNDPNAESPKGASGIMQVMPATAREIATELNDPNFPAGGSDEEVKAYLKDEATGRRYGRHYMDKMLVRYDGDAEAALVAYNGGPSRADEWIASGRDDSVLPKETREYKKKVLDKSGDTVPQVQFIDATPGKIRDKPVQQWVYDGLARAASATDSRIAIKVVSGGQDAKGSGGKRTGSARHDHGNAADIVLVVDGKEVKPSENKELYRQFFRNAAAMGFTGMGHYEWGVHIGGGAQAIWGPDKSSRTVDPDFAAAAAEGWGNPAKRGPAKAMKFAGNPAYAGLSIDQIRSLMNTAQSSLNERSAQDRAAIDIAMTNAPVAIRNTGSYDGMLPTGQQFVAAYGANEGAERYKAFQAEIDVSRSAFDMRTMPTDEITALVEDAMPRSSGNNAAVETARYDALSKAAQETIKTREADPAAYVRNTYPHVEQAWQDASMENGGFQEAFAATATAQQQLGIRNMQLLPKDVAENAVGQFKDVDLPEKERLATVAGLVMATGDPDQQRAIFEQLVDAGLPDMTEGAISALTRGDNGAAQRLFQAAMIDPDKLPGKLPGDVTKPMLSASIQASLMDEGQIGDIYYGITDGTAENYVRAERDSKLMMNSVILRMMSGETEEAAISGVAKDLYGDVKPVNEDQARILIPMDQDEDEVLTGLDRLMPQVQSALERIMVVPEDAPAADGTRAIMDSVTANYTRNVLSEGYFRNSGDGFVFFDPYTGAAVADENGNPIIFTMDDVLTVQPDPNRRDRDARAPEAPLTDDAFDAFQRRMQGQ